MISHQPSQIVDQKSVIAADSKVGIELDKILNWRATVDALVVLKDGQLACASWDKTIKLWDLKTYQCTQTLSGHSGYVISLALLENDGYLASGSWDTTIKLWDVITYQCVHTFDGHEGHVKAILALPDSRFASADDKFSGDDDSIEYGNIKIWNIKSRQCEMTLSSGGTIAGLVLLSNYSIVAAAQNIDFYGLSFWSKNKYKYNQCLYGKWGSYYWGTAITLFSNDLLVTTGAGQDIDIWDVKEFKKYKTIKKPGGSGDEIVLAALPENRLAIACGNEIKIWDVNSGYCVQTLTTPDSNEKIRALTALPDGRLASGSWNNTIKLWIIDPTTLRLLAHQKAENEARERAEREAREREAKERAEREAKERVEKETREKAERESKEREAKEKKALEARIKTLEEQSMPAQTTSQTPNPATVPSTMFHSSSNSPAANPQTASRPITASARDLKGEGNSGGIGVAGSGALEVGVEILNNKKGNDNSTTTHTYGNMTFGAITASEGSSITISFPPPPSPPQPKEEGCCLVM